MDLRLQATYYRTALLLGALRGEEVLRWAEDVIDREPEPPQALLDLVLVDPADLSELRHALWPLCVDPEPEPVLEAVLSLLHRDLSTGRRDLPTTITILRQMRSMLRLPPGLYSQLNETLVNHANTGDHASPIPQWLARFGRADERSTGT